MIPRCEKRNVDFSLVFTMKMRSWRVWLGSFWAHVEIMWCHCGHLGRTWGTWRAILEDLEQQEAKRGQQEAKRESKNENWWSKGGRRGAPRGTKGRRGFGSAAWGRQMGDIGGSSWRVLGEDLARLDHAKAWGGGFLRLTAHAADPKHIIL